MEHISWLHTYVVEILLKRNNLHGFNNECSKKTHNRCKIIKINYKIDLKLILEINIWN